MDPEADTIYYAFLLHFLPAILEAFFIALHGGFNLGCSKFQTFFIIFGMCFFPYVLFSLGAMFSTMGIVTTLKVIMRYPSIVAVAFRTGFVYAPHSYETVCNITSKGDRLQLHARLSFLNGILIVLFRVAIFCLPKNDSVIVTKSDDNVNILFGLQLTARQTNTIAIASFMCGSIMTSVWLYFYIKKRRKEGELEM